MTSIVLNNFVRGKLDEDLMGRFDLPIFQNGFPVIKNFYCNYKGNLKYRTGFEYVAQTKSNKPARLIPFRFNTNQTYLLELTDGYMRFYSYDNNGNFGYVTDDNDDILELNTGISYNNAKDIQKAQNADVMYLTSSNINPRKLKRTSATSFTIENVTATGIDFTTVGYPASATFYKGRLWYGGFSLKPTTIKGSKVMDYDNFTIPSSDIKDDDALSLQLSDITDPILWIVGGKRNLVVGNTEGICIVNGGTVDEPITSTAVNADLANREGASSALPTEKDSQMIYISTDKTKAYSFDYDLVTESFVSSNLNLLSEDLGSIKEVYYKRDKNNLIFGRLENGQMVVLLYNKAENITGWFPLDTDGEVISMTSLMRPDGKDDLFICVLRNGKYYVERLSDEVDFTGFYETDYFNDEDKEKYGRIQLEELKKCNYLDNGYKLQNYHTETITLEGTTLTASENVFTNDFVGHRIVYKTADGSQMGVMEVESVTDGTHAEVEVISESVTPASWNSWYLTFNKVIDLDDVEGLYQSVVADGGYIGDFLVENGEINLGKEYTSCWVGYPYKGFVKSFNFGFYTNGVNFQTLKKRISRFILRFVNSAGFKVGTTIENMQEVQEFNPNGYYDSCPLLMNGDEFVDYDDNHDREKNIYLIQDEPLPANLTMIECKVTFEKME